MGTRAKFSSSGPEVSVAQSRGWGRGPPTPDWPLYLNECCLFDQHREGQAYLLWRQTELHSNFSSTSNYLHDLVHLPLCVSVSLICKMEIVT